jgi:transcription termination factor Rho
VSLPAPAMPATGAGERPAPARPYRFSRAPHAIERPAPIPAAPGVPAESTIEPHAAAPAAAEAAAPAEPAEPLPDGVIRRTASDVPIRPLRRPDRNWTDRQGIAPHVPGGDGYRGRAPNRQGHAGRYGQPPMRSGAAPYTPGERGQPGAGNYEQPPYGSGGQNGGYAPYDPYAGYSPGSQPEPPAGQGRLPRRGYSGTRGYPDQRDRRDQRGPVPSNGRPSPGRPDLYREPGAPGGRGMPPGRGQQDRRGPGGRGTYGSRGRDAGYGAPAYAPPSQSGTPAVPAEGRYHPGRQGGPAPVVRTVDVSGILWLSGGAGVSPNDVLDGRTLQPIARMNPEDVRRLGLRSGDIVSGRAEERGARRLIVVVDTVNGVRPEEVRERPSFEALTASFPDRRIRLEQGPQPISARIIDLFAPLGFGSRALIVAPPKTGKTTLIREAAESVLKGYPDAVVMAVLVGERPEEVTDLRARLEPRGGLVYAASFDEDTQRHAWLVQVAVERAKRVAESGKDAFMVLDSLTRLARAENLASRGQGRTLSGGIDAQALDTGRRAFGAARNLEEGGSLTILATCLVETGSRQDDVVYEEFKGTGNMELHLSRELAQRRLFPAVDAVKSGTRREEMLLSPEELKAATALRRRLADLPTPQATQQLLNVMEKTPSNAALLAAIEQSGWTTMR